MGFLKNIIKNAVDDGISKGIRDAVSSAAEKIVAPKAEAYANKVADSFDEAAQAIDSASNAAGENSKEAKSGLSSLEESLNRLSQSAEKYAETMEKVVAENTEGLKEWNEKLPGFPVWCFGGKEFSINENYTSDDGTTYYYFDAVGATYEDMEAYVKVLKADGFVQKYKDSDQILYKDLGGEYLVFSSVEAFNDLDVMSVGMHRTKNKDDM